MFTLDPTLSRDTVEVADWPCCRVLLMNESRCPWLILVPRRPALRELHDLDGKDRAAVMEEVVRASRILSDTFRADKVNVGALGNIVEQLHVHVVARYRDDFAWPGPIWGKESPRHYDEETQSKILVMIRECAG